MKILLVGASGTLGRAIDAELSADHEILRAGRGSGDFRVDLRDDASVAELFRATGKVDAIVAASGNVHFGPLAEMTPAQFDSGLQDKLLGQVRLALIGQHHLNDGGSITLTTGILAEEPIRQGANATAVNAAVEGFARAAACELGRGLRINVVSPNALQESWEGYRAYFPGFEPVPAARAALAYRRSVEGVQSGRVYKVW
ncbi:short chain dehydrogenase [Luteimonas aquatica]|uniref:short chain dehydrogenase n=1 Tax=Luteimonas aquatica TaxID=450364 RepID=UPI001F5977EC|nr:short chain dehydrogenase [Luteimonas aquatica]